MRPCWSRSIAGCVAAAAIATTASGQSRPAVTDPRDGKQYSVVAIAGMVWMGRNLDFAAPGSWCPQGDEQLCRSMGRLYPWSLAVVACPVGWHLSSEDEWQRLEAFLGMPPEEIARERLRGAGLGDLLKQGGSSGLEFPLSGWRTARGTFAVGNGSDRAAALWTSTKAGDDEAWHRDVSSARSGIWRSAVQLDYSLSVRCVAD